MKIGVELEYWVTDIKGRLTSSKKIAEQLNFAEQEFVEPLIEIKTQPNEEFEQIKKEIIEKLEELIQTAEKQDQKIIPLGTPLNSKEIEKLHSERGEIQEKIVGEDLEAAKRVAGTHIHFEKKNVKEQLNTLTALDPALALTNSSPYYQGKKVASSSRNQVYRNKCYQNFSQHGQLWKYTDSVQEWEERISKAFEKFLQSGKEEGVSSEQIKNNFQPENAVWTPVRLRKDFPTVEWRAPDVGKLEDTLRMIREIKQVMENNSKPSKPTFDELEELSEKAINEGLQNKEVRDYLRKYDFEVKRYNPISQEIKSGENLSLEQARKIRLNIAEDFRDELKTY
jgi:gamma-glutamyl:cysteine ligase YbdK (ATP-grasp superfamily)